MRISDWSSDVCSSDLGNHEQGRGQGAGRAVRRQGRWIGFGQDGFGRRRAGRRVETQESRRVWHKGDRRSRMGSDRRRCERMMGASIFIKTFAYLIEILPSFYVFGTFWTGGSKDKTELLFFFRGLIYKCQ